MNPTKASNLFKALVADPSSIDEIIYHPREYSGWSLQGFGMLRLNLTKDIRLHVWSQEHQVKDVSLVHDHPWDFNSAILHGEMENRLYNQFAGPASGAPFQYATILCGPGGGKRSENQECFLEEYHRITFKRGQTYYQESDIIHASFPKTGTVTLVERYFKPDTEHARVFWPKGEQWVSAEPRPATAAEILDICQSVAL